MEVREEGVECPSLSPGTRVAFKSRSDPGIGPVTWRIAVFDLATSEVTLLAETRNVDDKVTWLDDSRSSMDWPTPIRPPSRTRGRCRQTAPGHPGLLVPGAWSTATIDG